MSRARSPRANVSRKSDRALANSDERTVRCHRCFLFIPSGHWIWRYMLGLDHRICLIISQFYFFTFIFFLSQAIKNALHAGIVGYLLKFITPLTIVPTVSLVGLSLFENAADAASQHWGIAAGYVSAI